MNSSRVNQNNIKLKVLQSNAKTNSMLEEYRVYINTPFNSYFGNEQYKLKTSPRDGQHKLIISAYDNDKMVGYLFAKYKHEKIRNKVIKILFPR